MSEAKDLYEKLSEEFNYYGVRSTSWSLLEKLYIKADACTKLESDLKAWQEMAGELARCIEGDLYCSDNCPCINRKLLTKFKTLKKERADEAEG
jgi:hypothetical protein